jgi:hypothetical protein
LVASHTYMWARSTIFRYGEWMRAYRIGLEPEGETYKRLIGAAIRVAASGFVVVRDSIELAPSGRAVLDKLKPFILSETRRDRWPGTVLLDEQASIYTFAVCDGSLEVLLQSAEALYEWQQPERPEDLGFLRSDETPWLLSVAHEGEAFILGSDEELTWLRETVPGLEPLIAENLDDV